MVTTSLLASILLATAVFAVPSPAIQPRSTHRSRFLDRTSSKVATNTTSHTVYSNNWSGASWESYPPATFTSVTGTFKVPTPSGVDGSASVWVGIDGDTCASAILQTGIDVSIKKGVVSYAAWYEWYPDYAYDFSDLAINAGDEIRLTVTASSVAKGVAKVENLTTGKVAQQALSAPSPTSILCQQNAEWIVEDFTNNGAAVAFCDFGTVQFNNAVATTIAGSKVSPDGAEVIIIQKNGKDYTSVQESPQGVTVSYI